MLSADALARGAGRSVTINLVFPEAVLCSIREGQSQEFTGGKDLCAQAMSHFLPPHSE